MSRKESVLLVSRALALYFTAWALFEITYLPEYMFALSHHINLKSVLAPRDYWTNYYLMLTVLIVVRMLAFFLAAVLFWRCGPRVEKLFSPHQDNQEPSE